MFIRKKLNKSGVVSVQIIDKSSGKYKLVKTVGSSPDAAEVEQLIWKAKQQLSELTSQPQLNFDIAKEQELVDLFFSSINEIFLYGPELLLGKIFNEIGFNAIQDELFRHLVITRPRHLWQTEKAFRISKMDLRIRPIYHKLKRRIEAHFCIDFLCI